MPLNPDEILREQFPDNVSISDLCDCGKHKKRTQGPPPIPRKTIPLPETDYRSTFKGTLQRPRSSKRPVSEGLRTNIPREPMFFDTNQRSDFRSHGYIERTKPIIPDLYGSAIFPTRSRKIQHGRRVSRSEEMFEPATAKVDGITSYTQEFIPKQLQTEYRRMEPRPNYIPSNAKFENRTTNKEHFRKWVPTKQVPFGEMPSFTGSILYPELKEKMPETVTQNSFKGEYVKRPDAIKLSESNIKMEGDMFMKTTNNDTFTRHEGDNRVKRTTHSPTLKVGKALGKFENQTQSKRDFPQYRNPERAIPAEPAPCTIDLKFDNKRSLTTEQKDIFKGHDVLVNPMAKAIRTDNAEYEPPTVKFETETSNKRDYVPKEMPKMTMRPAPPESHMQPRGDFKFDDRTMSKDFFQNWGAQVRPRYGDFHENRPYVPPQTKFDHDSITKTSFIPKKYVPLKDFKPEPKPVANEGDFDFRTVHMQTYVQPVVKPCRAQLFLLQRELQRLKQEREVSDPPAITAK